MKNNYTRYSQNPNEKKSPEVVEEPVVEAVTEVVEEPAVEPETPEKAAPVKGIVASCKKLNVRVKPSAIGDVVCILACGDTVVVDEDNSTNDWYKVRTAKGVEGFCMKNFIVIKS